MRCASYCNAESYDVDELAKHLRKEGQDPKFYDNVIHIHKERENTDQSQTDAEIFIFPYGCICAWGLSEEEELSIIKDIKKFQTGSLDAYTLDTCTYDYGETTHIDEEADAIVLESSDELLKLSIAHGLTQSVKLEAFEVKIAKTITKTKVLPEELAHMGRTSMSRKKLSQKIGALFAERYSINLHSDILDTPEFFWRRPRYEAIYKMSIEYMDIAQRMDILNKRLDVIHELYDILSNELKHAHSSRLEWIIILLIVSEVIMELLKYENVAAFMKNLGF